MGLLSKWVESLDYGLEILPSCTRHRSPRSSCNICMEVCQNESISLVDAKPNIKRTNCVECGSCISACPVQAVAGIIPKRTVVGNQLVITSQRFPTVKELLVLYKKGIRTIISEESARLEEMRKQIEEANSILFQLGEQLFTTAVKVVEEEVVEYTRRELFSFWRVESQALVRQLTPAKWRFNQKDLNLSKYFPNYQFAQITVNLETCSLCKACQRFCERQCFQVSEDKFIISAQACSSCQLCADICPEHAIMVEDRILPATKVEYLIYKKECQVCHNTFETLREHDEKCVMCTRREGFIF